MWLLLSLCFFVGAVYFWRLGNKWAAEKATAHPPSSRAEGQNGGAPIALQPSPLALQSLLAGNLNTTPGKASTNAAPASRFANRLSNTTKTMRQLVRSGKAILLENALMDTAQPLALSIPDHLRSQGDPGSYIVQSRSALDDAFRAALKEAGATIVSYIPNNAYLVRADAQAAQQLEGLPQTQAVLPYEPYYKLSGYSDSGPSLLELAVQQKSLDDFTSLNVLLFPDARAVTVPAIAKLGGRIMSVERSPFGPVLKVQPASDSLSGIAGLPGVQRVEMSRSRLLANDLSRVQVGVAEDTRTTVNYLGLTGTNVLMNINDTGVDQNHADLQPLNIKVTGDSLLSLVDTNGHGTHVAGTMAGSGLMSTTVTNAQGSINPGVVGQYRGMAPGANLFSMLFTEPDAYLQETAAQTNAFISNNGWNYFDNQYDLAAASYDAAVRDALPGVPGSQPILYVFSAGNAGAGSDDGQGGLSGTILSPGTAKNVITVGAIEQPRSITNEVTTTDGVNFFTNQVWMPMTDSSDQVAAFSSRGNVGTGIEGDSGRFKPDVVAPGTFVLSTRSSEWDEPSYYNPTNYQEFVYPVQTVETNTLNQYGFFLPNNSVQLIITAVSINPSNVNLPIYVRQVGPPTTTTYDVLGTNRVSLPPDAPLNPVDLDWHWAVGNSTNRPVEYLLHVRLGSTNNVGNYFQVLSNLNDTIGTSNYYRYESGTSMSAADVSGTLALMQEFFEQRAHLTNSPALMKALLINGARTINNNLYGFQVADSPNYQGWGCINLINSLPAGLSNAATQPPSIPAAMQIFDQSPTNALATGQSHTRLVRLSAAAQNQPLRATLVWTDPPGNPGASLKLVNNLDLVITNLDTGDVFFGNDIPSDSNYTSPWDTNGPPNLDLVNNVENVYLSANEAPLGTNYSVTVIGRNVNVNAVTANTNDVVQDYALVISSGDGDVTDAIAITDSATVTVIAPNVFFPTNSFANDPNRSGSFLLHQRAGASSPLLGTNTIMLTNEAGAVLTIGETNQWRFYVLTNSLNFTNAAFTVFPQSELSVPRIGVRQVDPANASRQDPDIDLYVSTDFGLTNLDPVAIGAADKSVGRGGTELLIFSNVQPSAIYYVGVKSEDQMAVEYGFLGVFSLFPFSSQDQNGNVTIANWTPATPANIPDGNNEFPGGVTMIGFAPQPALIRRAILTNSILHENLGDLTGSLNHNKLNAVPNNHRTAPISPASPGPYHFIYEDNHENNFTAPPGYTLLASDGPPTLRNFIAQKMSDGPWFFSESDNSQTQTGMVTELSLYLEPHSDSPLGVTVTIPPNGWFTDFKDVPAQATNLTICVEGITAPLELYVLYNDSALSQTHFDYHMTINPPGDCLAITTFSTPPLRAGRYYFGVYNPGPNSQTPTITATVFLSQATINSSITTTSAPIAILDDAVTSAYLTNNSHMLISGLDVGLLINDPRISDLAITLISPNGTRVLLFEDRGGLSPFGLGSLVGTSNLFGVMTPIYTNNFNFDSIGSYAPGAVFDGWNVLTNFVTVLPDWTQLAVSNNILALGDGVVSNMLPTTNSTSFSLSFRVNHAPYLFGMVGWWPFERDLNGHVDPSDIFGGHDGLLYGDVGAGLGEVGAAYIGDGVFTTMKVPRCPELNLGLTGRGFSIEGWIKPMPGTNILETFYISSAGNNVIQQYTSSGGFGTPFANSGLSSPEGLAFGINGCLYAANYNNNTVEVGSSRVDLQACKLEYSIVSPK